MSLTIDGVWKAGVWATTVWTDGVWREGAYVPSTTDTTVLNSIGGKPEKKKKHGEEYTWEWLSTLKPEVKEVIEKVAKQEVIKEATAEELISAKPNETQALNVLISELEDIGERIEDQYIDLLLKLRLFYIEEQIRLLQIQKQEEMDIMAILMMEM